MTYTDGDEEELSQKELRDGYVLGLEPEIEAEWKKFTETRKDKDDDEIEADTSEGEGSVYDKSSEEEEEKKKAKRRARHKKPPIEKPRKRAKAIELSGSILPQHGDKMVAGEAFEELSASQKQLSPTKSTRKRRR